MQDVRVEYISGKPYQKEARFFRIMANPVRLAILYAVEENELTMTQLSELLDLKKANISQQLGHLSRFGLVQLRQQGRYRKYRLTHPDIVSFCRAISGM